MRIADCGLRSADQVLIVGSGPAGCIAALALARAGVRVRLVDRARFPRDKLCGDTLNPGALARLERLGVAERVRARALPVAGMIVTGPGGARIVGEYAGGVRGGAVRRSVLDQQLLEAALEAGVRFDEGVHVRSPVVGSDGRLAGIRAAAAAGEHELRARVIIAADGRASRLAFSLGLARYARPRRWAFGAYFTDVEGLTSCGEMHIRPGGYLGVAPLPGGLTNVCVVREVPFLSGARGLDASRIMQLALMEEPALWRRFAAARRVTRVSVLGPLAVEARAAGLPGLLLAGDAAGFIDPMTGDGLRFAIRGAELAAACALQELETGRPMHGALAEARRREFGGKYRMNRALRALVASPRSVRAAARVAMAWHAPVRALIGFAGDVHTI